MTDRLRSDLMARLANGQTGASAQHPDADCLNAYRERRLAAAVRASVSDHLAGCAGCREILSVSAQTGEQLPKEATAGPRWVLRLAAAAVLTALFLGGTLSPMDDGVITRRFVNSRGAPSKFVGGLGRTPKLAYASAELKRPAPVFQWRIRGKGKAEVLESSADGGKSWRAAKLDRAFEPDAVGFSGMDVWVKSRSGEVLLSSDAGLRWTLLKTAQRR